MYDVQAGKTKVLLRLPNFDRLSNLAWSSDGKYIAFTQGDGRGTPRSLWVVSTDGTGRQRLTDGLLATWAPDGLRLVYARPGTGRLLDWYMLDIKAKGGK